MRFWDVTAVVPLCVTDLYTGLALREARADGEMVAWWATRVESAAGIARLRQDGRLTPDDEARALALLKRLSLSWLEVEPTDRVRSLAAVLLRRHPLRSADALQLGAALEWSGPDPTGCGFVTFDVRLAAAAALEGFTVIGAP